MVPQEPPFPFSGLIIADWIPTSDNRLATLSSSSGEASITTTPSVSSIMVTDGSPRDVWERARTVTVVSNDNPLVAQRFGIAPSTELFENLVGVRAEFRRHRGRAGRRAMEVGRGRR